MKKIISLLLVLVMCMALFAGCVQNETPTEDNSLTRVKEFLAGKYGSTRGTETALDYTVISNVPIGDTTYAITWTIEVTAGDGSCLSVVAGKDETTIKVEKNYTDTVVEYNLVGTVTSGDKSESIKIAHSVPVSKRVSEVADGTYLIVANGLSLAAMAESYNYGYPTGNAVTADSFTAVDVVTIKNVDGGITIQDSYGRYLYLKGSYNSFNLSKDAPEEGHIFEIQVNDDNTLSIVNVLMQKTLAYSTSYSSWGCYASLNDDYCSIVTIIPVDAANAAS